MHVRRFATHVEILAPAKINLILQVLARRADGFHEIETVIAPISLFDTLQFEPKAGGDITLECRWAAGPARELLNGVIPCGPENLVWRAAALLQRCAGIEIGAQMRLIKRIPMAAGLGGGSSDAAAALVAANIGWRLNWPVGRLQDLAGELGSDVPFFLQRGAAVCRGRGERIESAAVPRMQVVVAQPPVGLSTRRVYERCHPSNTPPTSGRLFAALARGRIAEAARCLTNDLQPASESLTPWIGGLSQAFQQQGLLGHQMSGSGSSYFGIGRSRRHVRRVAARLRARRLGTAQFAVTSAR